MATINKVSNSFVQEWYYTNNILPKTGDPTWSKVGKFIVIIR